MDVVARLQLRAEQFSSETGRAFADMKTRAASTAADIKNTFNTSFAEVSRLADNALTFKRTKTGSLDLSSEIASLNAAALAAEQNAQALTELSVAQSAAAAKGGAFAEAMKLDADASAVAALAAEQNAKAIRDRITALEGVQGELNRNISLTDRHTASQAKNAISAGQQRNAMQQLSFQIGDIAQGYAAGTPAATIFAQQSGQVVQALQLMIPAGEGALGVIAGFAPWVGAALVVLTPFVAKLFESGDAIDKEVDKLRKDSAETEINRQARERFNDTLQGQIDNWRKLNDEITKSILTQQQQDYAQFAKKNDQLNESYARRIQITNDLAVAQASLNRELEYQKTHREELIGDTAFVANLEGLKQRVATLQQNLAVVNKEIPAGEKAVRGAQVPLIERNATVSVDAVAGATERYTAALGQLRKEFAKGILSQQQFDAAVAQAQRTRDIDIKKAQDAKSAAEKLAKEGPLTTFMLPVNGTVSSPFGAKRSYETHPGVDLAVPVGTPVRAPASGTVDAAGLQGKLGNTIVINFGAGTTARFGHLTKFNVKPGDTVDAGDIIGYSGGAKGAEGAGNSTGPHLHYEVRRNGKLVNPMTGQFPTDAGAASDDATKRAAAAQRAAEALAASQQRAADTILRINSEWDDQPKLIDRAAIETNKLQVIIALYSGKTDEASKAIVSGAEAAKRVIADGIDRPFRDYVRSQKESLAVQTLSLQGRDVEAAAMEDILRLQQQQGRVTDQQINQAYAYEAAQKRIAEALQDQQRILNISSTYVGSMQRDFDKFLEDMDNGSRSALPNLLKGWLNDFKQLRRDLISNAVFGGVERDIQQYIRQMTGKQTPAEILAGQAEDSGKVMRAAYDDAGDAVRDFATSMRDAMKSITGSPGSPFAFGGEGDRVTKKPTTDDVRALLQSGLPGIPAANDNVWSGADIIVTGIKDAAQSQAKSADKMLSATDIWTRVSQDLVKNFAQMGIEIPKGIASALPGMLQGASIFSSIGAQFGGQGGNIGAGLGASLGALLKPDSAFMKNLGPYAAAYQLGQAISQPIGKALGLNPTAVSIGGVPGGLIAKLFGIGAPQHKGSAGIGLDQYGQLGSTGATGTSSQRSQGAASMADAVAQGIQQIAEQLGAQITGKSDVRIGTYENHIRVNDHGGAIGGVKGSGAISFDTQEAAVSYAIQAALQDGILSGISAASLKILKSGQDINRAITKALAIESIPHDLKAMLDPLGSAIDDLNKKWQSTVDALNEGGATAEQFAQAQQLYNLQLTQVKASTASASQSLKDFLTSLKLGSDSPYSLRDQEATARQQLQPYLDAIASGQTIDQGKYQDAAQAFLDVERQIYGSTQDYFAAMDKIQAATSNAIATIDNAVPITPGMPDPFTKATADATNTVAANTQTTNELLVQLTDALNQQTMRLEALGIAPDTGFVNAARNYLLKQAS